MLTLLTFLSFFFVDFFSVLRWLVIVFAQINGVNGANAWGMELGVGFWMD